MRKAWVIPIILFALLVLGDKAIAAPRPNILVIQTDDQAFSLLKGKYRNQYNKVVPVMPKVKKLLLNQGTEFRNYYANTPICGPSRASLLSGQMAHNTRVIGNRGPLGGWEGWSNSHIYKKNLATRLQSKGYHTGHFGKLTNWYGEEGPPGVPPGWDTWVTDYTDDSTRDYYGYYQFEKFANTEGSLVGPIGNPLYGPGFGIDPFRCAPGVPIIKPCNYHTDRMTTMASKDIKLVVKEKKPFYIQVDYHAPHGDKDPPAGPQPATRDVLKTRRTDVPKPNSRIAPNFNYNEKNTRDKPFVIQETNGPIKPGNINKIRNSYRTAVGSLQAVDKGVAFLYKTLKQTGQLRNTYIIFTSDNGLFYGDHRFLTSKALAYQESARLPFVIMGPDIPKGKVSHRASSVVDVAPTILKLTDTPRGNLRLDGSSMNSGWLHPKAKKRRVQLIEYIGPGDLEGNHKGLQHTPYILDPNRPASKPPNVRYTAVKIGKFKYVEYNQGGTELYDLRNDPNELYNQSDNPGYTKLKRYMKKNLKIAQICSGQSCRRDPGKIPRPNNFTQLVDYPKLLESSKGVDNFWIDAIDTIRQEFYLN